MSKWRRAQLILSTGKSGLHALTGPVVAAAIVFSTGQHRIKTHGKTPEERLELYYKTAIDIRVSSVNPRCVRFYGADWCIRKATDKAIVFLDRRSYIHNQGMWPWQQEAADDVAHITRDSLVRDLESCCLGHKRYV